MAYLVSQFYNWLCILLRSIGFLHSTGTVAELREKNVTCSLSSVAASRVSSHPPLLLLPDCWGKFHQSCLDFWAQSRQTGRDRQTGAGSIVWDSPSCHLCWWCLVWPYILYHSEWDLTLVPALEQGPLPLFCRLVVSIATQIGTEDLRCPN